MRQYRGVCSFVFVVVSACTALAQGGNPRFTNLQIHVQVRYANGSAASRGIAVIAESEDGGVVGSEQTDSQGKVSFTVSAADFYTVRVNQPGYVTPPTQRVDLHTAKTGYVVFELRPIPGASTLPPEGPTGRVEANQIPKDALKEFKLGETLLMKDQKVDDSIPHLRKAISISKDYTDAYVMLGFAYLAQKDPSQAMSVLKKALELDPKSWMAHVELGAAYNLYKRFPDAERELQAGLALNDKAALGHYELAKTYWVTNRWQDAEPHAATAVALAPDLAAAHVLLGNVKLRKKDYAGAKHEFEEYLRIEPDGPMASASKDMIAKLNKAANTNHP